VCCVLCELCESSLALEWCKSWGVAGVKAASQKHRHLEAGLFLALP
jgi:hypothetical protein